MASADLRKELECSVCLDFYTDPAILKCGHNFCWDCIGRVLDTQEGSGGYSCPECKQSFQKRPVLQRNLKLRNIVENFLSTHPDQEESGVFCTYCIHIPIPAVKSCLLCEASLCDDHLRVHSKSPEHVLCDPTTSLENRKCSVHKELLKYYCTEDSTCICVSCILVGEHRGHQVETLDEASEKKKKKLRNVLQKLSLQEHRRNDEDRERHDKLLHDGEDLDVGGSSHTLHTGLSDIMSGVNAEKCPGTHVYPHSTTKGRGHINAEPSRSEPKPTPPYNHPGQNPSPPPPYSHSHRQAGGPNIRGVQQTSGVTGILLDVSTAGNNLEILHDRKTIYRSSYQSWSDTPKRFFCPQVMSRQSFSSGRHYWEVDVGKSGFWIVGMCYPSIDRRGDQSLIGSNNKSWGLEGRELYPYTAIHDSNKIPLSSKGISKKLRIDLDYEAGRISFYDLCDPIQHLHTFTTTFTEPLHAILNVGRNQLKIS
ncbi:E3 ubiquitin/ISG15 ligase TRIM25-like isoform X2 [Aquarana catesbeiana]